MNGYIFASVMQDREEYTIYKIGTNLRDVFESAYFNGSNFVVYVDGEGNDIICVGLVGDVKGIIKKFTDDGKYEHCELYKQLIELLEEKQKIYEELVCNLNKKK
jgi:hypothetical protein